MDGTGSGRVVIISGPIGAGKTTVAAELVKEPPWPTARIEGDEFWKFVARAKEGPPQEAFRVILRAMCSTAAAFARDGYEAVLDFTVPPDYPVRAGKLFAGCELHLVVLRPSPEVCLERAATRPQGAMRDAGGLLEFYQLFNAVEARHVIADAGAAPAAVAARIREGIGRGEFLLRTAP